MNERKSHYVRTRNRQGKSRKGLFLHSLFPRVDALLHVIPQTNRNLLSERRLENAVDYAIVHFRHGEFQTSSSTSNLLPFGVY